jgi:hypothetical protein
LAARATEVTAFEEEEAWGIAEEEGTCIEGQEVKRNNALQSDEGTLSQEDTDFNGTFVREVGNEVMSKAFIYNL